MGQNCIILQSGRCEITNNYYATHTAVDVVREGMKLDNIVAHSSGKVVAILKNCNENTSGMQRYDSKRLAKIYGNYVKIRHDNGMYTLYAHMTYNSIQVNLDDYVSRGQVLGYMGNTGYSFGSHLHFEVRDSNNVCINPTEYLEKDLPKENSEEYSLGNYITLYNMKVRNGVWGRHKSKTELSLDGQKNCVSGIMGTYRKSTIFTAKKIIYHTDGSVWAISPSGYICIEDKSQIYCKKV